MTDDAISFEAVKNTMFMVQRTAFISDNEFLRTMDLLMRLPSINPQEPKTGRWIPVSERLPEKNVWVLVTVIQESDWYVEIMRIDKYKGMFTDNIDYYDSVIAWMPLPEPYKPQEGEEV